MAFRVSGGAPSDGDGVERALCDALKFTRQYMDLLPEWLSQDSRRYHMTIIKNIRTESNAGCHSAPAITRRAFQHVLLAAFAVCFLGCSSGMFTPSELPHSLVAKHAISASHLNLSGLNSSAMQVNSIYPGDVLQVDVVTGAGKRTETNWRLRVDENGAIPLPQVGPIRVAGLELVAAERLIGDVYRRREIYLHPSVSLTVDVRRTKRVTVEGAVEKPGNYDLPIGNADIADALLAAGGLTAEADVIVEVRHARGFGIGNPSSPDHAAWQHAQQVGYQYSPESQVNIRRINLATIRSEDQASQMLEDGAVVTVVRRPIPTVSVIGLVKQNKQIKIPPGDEMRVLDAITAAGGTSADLADKVFIVRRVPGSEETVIINTSIKKAKRDLSWNVLLASGDVVSVEETPQTFLWRGVSNILNVAWLGARFSTLGL
jgi:polysaccharide export outer membrane protein